jgi:Reverse transcriptase (RNA-dependent DNA polymerase)
MEPSEPESEAEAPAKRMRKPSQHIRDILDGHGTSSHRKSDPVITPGIQLPAAKNQDIVLEGEGSAEWMMIAEEMDEYALVAETSEVEAIEPRSLAEARHRPDWELWEKGIIEELELLTPPENANIVGSKWVFCTKKDAAGKVVCYKACLVVQGFSQVPGVDYFNTFAPVAKLASIRMVLALAVAKDMEIRQIDIKGAYLNGELHGSAPRLSCSKLHWKGVSSSKDAVRAETIWEAMVSKTCRNNDSPLSFLKMRR